MADDSPPEDDAVALADIPTLVDVAPLFSGKDNPVRCMGPVAFLDLADDFAAEQDPVGEADLLVLVDVALFRA
jgi:hypothetical protein